MTARNVVVQTGSEVVTLTNGFTVTSQGFTVTLTGVSPATTSPLSTVQLNASGFVGSVNAGSVAVTLTPIGGGPALGPIPAASSQVLPGDILRVSFVIPAGTSLGSYLPAISGQNAAGTSFTTANPSSLTLVVVAPAITINPNQGPAGQSLAVAITGNFTHFQQGTTQANFGPGVSVGGGPEGGLGLITVTSPTSATANILIAAGAATNTRDVVVQTASEVVTLSNGFTVIGAASISVNPPQGQQGATLSVTITGTNTSFAQGTTAVSFEPGITVNSVTVIGPTSLTADITIPNNTPLVARDVTVTTGAQVVTAANAFLVVAGPKSITATPASGSQGATMNVTIGGVNTNFSAASQVTFTGGIIVNATTLNTAQSLTASITIPAGESLGAHTLTVTTGSEVVSTTFSVIEAPARTLSVAPNQGQQGQTLSVTVTGQNTNFVQGVTSVGFGPGVTINSVAVSSSTSLTVNLSIPNNAALGARDVTATTSGEVVTAPGAFAIIPGTRSITVTPSSGQQGSTLNLTITGVNTNFAPASQVSFSQSGITVNSVSLNSATSLTASITIAADATVGLRDVTVSTASEVVTAAGAFSVNAASTARLVSVVPSTGQRGQSLAVTITGENTGFAQGSSIVSFGPGITVTSIAVASSTVLTAQITIANDAEIGARTVTVTTGSQMAALPSGFFVVGSGSTQPFTCVVNAGVPPLVRAEGLTELVGDLVIVCTGGQAGTTQHANVQLFLNTNITSRQIGSSDTEALLIVDELGALPGLSGGTPAVYRGQRTSGENAVVWPGVTVVAPGAGQRILRITNVRANAALLGASTTLIPNQITAFLSASPSQSLPLSSPQQTVAYIAPGLTFDLRNCAGTQTLTNVNLAQCVGANNSGSRNLISGATGDMQFAVRFQEGFQTAFRPQLTSGQIPSIPGTVYNSESGFVRSTSDLPYAIGGADHGTRLVARFQNVPAGVRLFVTTVPGAGSSSGVAAILVQTGPNGEGGTLPQSTTPFAVPSTATINCPGSSLAGVPAAEISVVNGTALAVWEITAANPAFLESAVFGVAVAYTPDIQNRAPAAGQVRVAGSFGPFYGIESAGRASATLPVPRFADQPVVANAFSIEACVTHLLFPFVTNRSGFDTGIAISNTSRDHFGSQSDRLQSGPCTIHYFGQTDNSGAPPATQKTTSNIGAGETLTFIVSSGGNFGINATPGFQGYIFAQCEFQYAHGFAFITDGPVGAARVAEGYLALVLSTPVINRGGGAESLSQ
jgi:hypothetical protein